MLKTVQIFSEDDFLPKKKNRVKKNMSFYIQRQRKTVSKSETVKLVEEMIKNNIRDYEGVKNFLKQRFSKIKDGTIGLYYMLASAKIMNGAIGVTDSFANKKLKRYAYMYNQQGRVFSNDRLILENLYVELTEAVEKGGFKLSAEYNDMCNIRSCLMCSPSFMYEGECQKGYYQDFDEEFAAVGLETLEAGEREALLTYDVRLKVRDFEYNNLTYDVFEYKDACVIASTRLVEKKNGNELYKRMVRFKGGNKYSIDAKTFDLKKKIKYIDMKLHPETFCPAFLILPRVVPVNIMFTVEYNYNDLFNKIANDYKNTARIQLPSNLFYWDQMEECMDLIAMLVFTIPGMSDDDKKFLAGLYDTYTTYRPMLISLARISLKMVNCLKEFYGSFTTKINYDKLTNLQKKLREVYEERARFEASDFRVETIAFIKDLNDKLQIAQYCMHQMGAEYLSTVNMVDGILKDLVDSTKGNIIKDIKNVSQRIYMLTPCGEKGAISAFPWLFSVGAHLGALNYALINENILQTGIEKEEKKREELIMKVEDRNERVQNILNNLIAYQKKLITNTIEEYVKNRGLKVNQDQKDEMANILFNSIQENEKDKEMINKELINTVMKNGEIKNEYLQDFDLFDKMFEEINIRKEIKKVDEKIEDAKRIKRDLKGALKEINYDKDDIEMSEDDEGAGLKKDDESLFSKLSIDTTDSLGYLEDAYAYMAGKKKDLSINMIDYSKQAALNGKINNWVRQLIYLSGIYPIESIENLKGSNAVELLKFYPVSHNIINEMIRVGTLPSLKAYLEAKGPYKFTTNKFSQNREAMFSKNQKDIESGGDYIPKVFLNLPKKKSTIKVSKKKK